MSESITPPPPPRAKQSRRVAQPSERKGGNETGGFEGRRAELALLLIGLDREFWKRGMSDATGHDPGTSASGHTDDDELRRLSEVTRITDDERKHVREVTGTMFRELELRLAVFADASTRLGEDERASLAALLRLPEAKRCAIAAMLRLPERERSVLRIAFALSGAECDALADLLRPMPAPAAERSSITIVDPSVVEEDDTSAA